MRLVNKEVGKKRYNVKVN